MSMLARDGRYTQLGAGGPGRDVFSDAERFIEGFCSGVRPPREGPRAAEPSPEGVPASLNPGPAVPRGPLGSATPTVRWPHVRGGPV